MITLWLVFTIAVWLVAAVALFAIPFTDSPKAPSIAASAMLVAFISTVFLYYTHFYEPTTIRVYIGG